MPATPDERPTVRLTREEALANRETVRLPTQRAPRASAKPSRRAPLALAATVTSTWAAIVSFAPMLLVVGLLYLVDGDGAAAGRVIRLGLAAWLLAHGVPLEIGDGVLALAPLALGALAAWRVYRAGVHTARAVAARRSRRPWPAVAAGAAVAVVYAGLGAAAAAAAPPGVVVSPVRAGAGLGVFALVAGVAGALREAGVYGRLAQRTPEVIRDGIRTGVVAGLLVLAAGALAAGVAVAMSFQEAADIIDDYDTGFAGQAGLTLVCLLYAPNVAVWAAAYLIGPGFFVGVDTTVSAAQVQIGPMPAAPILAGLLSAPEPASGLGVMLLGVPLAAALVAGWLLARRHPAARSWRDVIGAAALAGPVAGLVLGAASVLSSGSLGDARLATVGPPALRVAVTAAAIVMIGTVLAASATKLALRKP